MLKQGLIILGVVVGVGLLNMWNEQQHNVRLKHSMGRKHAPDSIFVLMPVYEETENAGDTLESLFMAAAVPTRVHVGVVQHAAESNDTLAAYQTVSQHPFLANIHMLRYPLHWREGAPAARIMGMQFLFNNQTYVLTVDAHTVFRDGWDEFLIEELLSLPPRSILTTLPPQHNEFNCGSTLVRVKSVPEHYMPAMEGLPTTKPPVTPLASPFFAAAFAFGPADAFKAWDIEPHVNNLCLTHSAQLLDRGWRFYVPSICPLTQDWTQSNPEQQQPSRGFLREITNQMQDRAGVQGIMGVDLVTGTITDARVQQGLMPENERTREEMVCKIGSSKAMGFINTH